MKLVTGTPEIPWWQAHPEYGFDWNAYRKLEADMIKRGDLRALSDMHQAIDEESLMEAYDSRAMEAFKERYLKSRGQAPRAVSAPQNPARTLLADPEFAGRAPGRAAVLARSPWLMAASMMLMPSEIGQDSWNPKYAEPGVDVRPEVFKAVGNAYSRVRGKR